MLTWSSGRTVEGITQFVNQFNDIIKGPPKVTRWKMPTCLKLDLRVCSFCASVVKCFAYRPDPDPALSMILDTKGEVELWNFLNCGGTLGTNCVHLHIAIVILPDGFTQFTSAIFVLSLTWWQSTINEW